MAKPGRLEAVIDNADGQAPLLLVCEHASNFVPPAFERLGLCEAALSDHIAWDIGAHALARRLAEALDAPLIAAPASRLLVDVNRAFDAHDLIVETAEGAPVPGNLNLSEEQREARVRAYHAPFHEAIEALLARRPDIIALTAVHSFTPVFFGEQRPWHAGVLHGPDARMADAMLDVLTREAGLTIGRNQPYAPEQGVFYTMSRHAGRRATAMIEVRNDLIRDDAGLSRWAQLLGGALRASLAALAEEHSSSGLIGRRS